MFKDDSKKRIIKKYFSKLPTELKQRYGELPPWSEAQVRTTIKDLGLSEKYLDYAFLMFCSKKVLIGLGTSQHKINQLKSSLNENIYGTATTIYGPSHS